MFKGYSVAGLHKETLLLFHEMMKRRRDDEFVTPSDYTFTFVLKSCSFLSALRDGVQVHCYTVKTGWFRSNHFVGTMLIDMYSSVVEKARKVFDEMPVKNVVSWTAIVSAYISAGDVVSARRIFDQAAGLDVVLRNTMISGYTERGDMVAARELFSEMPDHERDAMAWNTVLLGYANADERLVEECERFFFEEMPDEKKNVFSWNSLIAVYSRHGWFYHVLHAFHQMLFRGSLGSTTEPVDATISIVLSACSKLGALSFGRAIHSCAAKRHQKILMSACVGNGLVDLYAKCGCIEDANKVFRHMEGTVDLITWNSMIGGLAAHGRGLEALQLFEEMEVGKCRPDGITFVGILSACVHSLGLVERGIAYFKSMVEEYNIHPWIEHYGCVVDLLGRAGLIDKAVNFIRRMSMSIVPDCVIWSTLLGACQQQLGEHGHEPEYCRKILIVAELAMSRLVRLEPEDVNHYVILSKAYGSCRRWEDVARLKKVVNKMCSRQSKLPGWSGIQVELHSHSQIVEFCSSDTRHARTKEIHEMLQSLSNMSMLDAVTDFLAPA